jgi:hypothetical protein
MILSKQISIIYYLLVIEDLAARSLLRYVRRPAMNYQSVLTGWFLVFCDAALHVVVVM